MVASSQKKLHQDASAKWPKRHWVLGYFRSLGSGAVVGVVCVLIREAIAWLLGADTKTHYFISVFVVYGIGFMLSYILQARFVFQSTMQNSWSLNRVSGFVAVALTGAVAASWLSSAIRYEFALDILVGRIAPAVSLILAATLIALPTYSINRFFVFRNTAKA